MRRGAGAVGRGNPVTAAVVAGLAMVVAGCTLVRSTPALRHWVLAVPPSGGAPLPAPVRVGTVTADPAYASSRLAIRTSPYAIDYRVYDRWASPPRSLLAAVLRDALEQDAGDGAPVVVEGEVRRIEGVVDDDAARGDVVLQLRAIRGGAVLVDETYAEVEPARSDDPEDLAAALSRALGRTIARFREALDAALRRRGGGAAG